MGHGGTLIAPLPPGLAGETAFVLAAFFLIAGAVIGSFAGAAALRIARGDSVVRGRSRCDSCGRRLGPIDLVPVLSFAVLRGRCRTCKARIDPLQWLAEIAGGAIGLIAWLTFGFMGRDLMQAALLALFGWQLLVLGLSDLRSFHLPPVGIGLLAVSAMLLPAMAWVGGGDVLPILLRQLAGGALGFLLLAAPALAYRVLRGREGLGRADPPLMGAIGLWLGVSGAAFTILLAAAAGIVAAIALRFLSESARAKPRESEAGEPLPDGAHPLGSLLSLAAWVVAIAGFSPIWLLRVGIGMS